MYKVGDEVLVKAKVDDVDENASDGMEVRVKVIGCCPQWIKEKEIASKTYAQGLADAWEFAKKLMGTDHKQRNEIFGLDSSCNGIRDVYERFTPQEALAKIEAYERKKEIKEKCIVESFDGSHKGVVTCVRAKGDFFVLWDNGTADTYEKHEVRNTGKTAESLDSLLRQIGE